MMAAYGLLLNRKVITKACGNPYRQTPTNPSHPPTIISDRFQLDINTTGRDDLRILQPYTKPFRAPFRMANASWYRGLIGKGAMSVDAEKRRGDRAPRLTL
jgi:hypothetical protein